MPTTVSKCFLYHLDDEVKWIEHKRAQGIWCNIQFFPHEAWSLFMAWISIRATVQISLHRLKLSWCVKTNLNVDDSSTCIYEYGGAFSLNIFFMWYSSLEYTMWWEMPRISITTYWNMLVLINYIEQSLNHMHM
jgi:hypothetical protein